MPDLRTLLTTAAPRPARPAPDEPTLARRAAARARHRRAAALAATGVVVAVATGGAILAAGAGHDESEVAGGPHVSGVQSPGAGRRGPAGPYDGLLAYDAETGCYALVHGGAGDVRVPLAWPTGTSGLQDGPGVRLPDGTEVRPGQKLSGRGTLLDPTALPQLCRPLDGGVILVGEHVVAGPPPRLVVAPAGGVGMQALLVGQVTYDGDTGCYLLRQAPESMALPIVWPAGTRLAADGPAVVLPGGTTVRHGDRVRATGGIVTPEAAGVTLPSACGGDAAVLGSVEEVVH